jgi:hypothetical protein
MNRVVSVLQKLFTGTTKIPVLVSAYRHVVVQITITGAGAGGEVIKFRASGQPDKPDFDSAATQSNFHAPVMVKDLATGTTYAGAVGVPASATGVYLLEVNTNLISWLSVDNSAAATAVYTADVVAASN